MNLFNAQKPNCFRSVAMMALVSTIGFSGGLSAHENAPSRNHTEQHSRQHAQVVDMKKMMMGMNLSMAAIPSTGDPDYDFAVLMRMHHAGAIDMSRAELAFGDDPEMREMAKKIIVDQKMEIEEFDRWLDRHEDTLDDLDASDRAAARAMLQRNRTNMQKMMAEMEAIPTSRDTDYNFAVMMRMHHQMAIDMSEAELASGDDTEMRTKAQQIITMQKAEIAEINRWLEHYKPKNKPKTKS